MAFLNRRLVGSHIPLKGRRPGAAAITLPMCVRRSELKMVADIILPDAP